MLTALVIVALIMAYLVGFGVVYVMTTAYRLDHGSNYDDASMAGIWAGLFWPLALPGFLGAYIARAPERRKQADAARAAEVKRIEQELGFDEKGI